MTSDIKASAFAAAADDAVLSKMHQMSRASDPATSSAAIARMLSA